MLQFHSAQPNPSLAVVRFGGSPARKGKDLNAQTQSNLQLKADAFQQGLNELVSWDKQTHKEPVLLRVDTKSLTKQAQAFLRKQAMSPLWKTNPYLIGVAGGTASGKSFATEMWQKIFRDEAGNHDETSPQERGPVMDYLQFDYSYYKGMAARRKALGHDQFFLKTNLDVPASMTMGRARKDLENLKKGFALRVPDYKFKDSSRTEGFKLRIPTPFFIAEGLFALLPDKLRPLYDMKIFVDATPEVRTDRWWKRAASRDMVDNEAGRAMFNRAMKEHDTYVEPTKNHADIVMNGNSRQPELAETLTKLTQLLLKTFYPPTLEVDSSGLCKKVSN